jgi:hypothetical protein
MAAAKRSGHARLKAALVLRDALAAELGISLSAAMTQLRTVENNIGAAAWSYRWQVSGSHQFGVHRGCRIIYRHLDGDVRLRPVVGCALRPGMPSIWH